MPPCTLTGIVAGLTSSAIRISNIFNEYGISQTTAEDLLRKFLPACFRLQWDPSHAIIALRKFIESAERYGHTPMEHALYFNKLQESEQRHLLKIHQERKKIE